MRQSLLSLITLTVLSVVAILSSPSPTRAATVSIEVGNLYFCDVSHNGEVCNTTIIAGDTVTWNNVAGFHTVTECDDTFSTCPPAGGFDSGNLIAGNSFSHVFASPGVYAYLCMAHPTDMRGRITVQAAPTPTPTPAATAAPGVSTTPSPSAATAPASVPKAGGFPGDGGTDAEAMALAMLGGLLLTAAVIGVPGAVRARD